MRNDYGDVIAQLFSLSSVEISSTIMFSFPEDYFKQGWAPWPHLCPLWTLRRRNEAQSKESMMNFDLKLKNCRCLNLYVYVLCKFIIL